MGVPSEKAGRSVRSAKSHLEYVRDGFQCLDISDKCRSDLIDIADIATAILSWRSEGQ